MIKTRYAILAAKEYEKVDFSKVIETAQTIRYSMDGSKFIVKYIGEKPEFLGDTATYDHAEILEVINDAEHGWLDL